MSCYFSRDWTHYFNPYFHKVVRVCLPTRGHKRPHFYVLEYIGRVSQQTSVTLVTFIHRSIQLFSSYDFSPQACGSTKTDPSKYMRVLNSTSSVHKDLEPFCLLEVHHVFTRTLGAASNTFLLIYLQLFSFLSNQMSYVSVEYSALLSQYG